MRFLCVMLAIMGLAASVDGCGSGGAGTMAAGARVESGTCQTSGANSSLVSQSCEFALSDGQRFRCSNSFEGQTPTARTLEHARGCMRLPSLKLSAAELAMIKALDGTRICLTSQGLHAIGGAVLPPSPGANMADGEVVISSSHPTVIAFYTDAARAMRARASVVGNARRARGLVDRRGAATIFWAGIPSRELRGSVETCVSR